MRSSVPTPIDSRPSTAVDEQQPEAPQIPSGSLSSQPQEKDDPFLVSISDDDPTNPKNWPKWRKWYTTMLSGMLVLNATFSSSAPSGILPEMMEHFHMSQMLGILTISLFVAGYCYGRRPVFLIAFSIYTCFQVGSALAKNTASVLIFRFLGGTFAAAPLTNSGGVISDIWDARTRGKAISIFTLAPFAGPALGPIVAGYISVAGVNWRWVYWVMVIFAGACLVQIIFTLPETYMPALLVAKAKKLRKETGDDRYYAPLERQQVTFVERMEGILAKPFKMLISEPMLLAITLYMSFIYGCVYLLFEAFPFVFVEGHHFNAGESGLTFLPLAIGGALGSCGYLLIFNPRYERAVEKYAPQPVPPEFRLEMTLFSAPAFCLSFFWFAWTSYPSISYWAPLLSVVLTGFSIIWLFLPMFNYMIDTYLFAAASALAANTVMRSLFGAGFPLFATQMYKSLGPRWASSVLGFISLALVPVPFGLMKYGPILRAKSRYAPTKPPAPIAATMTAEKKTSDVYVSQV